jgi:hypothetical protein
MEVAVVVLAGGGAYINREKIMTIFSFFSMLKCVAALITQEKMIFVYFIIILKKRSLICFY